MSSVQLAFSSEGVRALSSLRVGECGVVVDVCGRTRESAGRADRLLALGVTPGASVTMLQTFPGVVFLCDQTELVVERAVARSVLVRIDKKKGVDRSTERSNRSKAAVEEANRTQVSPEHMENYS
jgi:Fe2+ transport system protein FeoA